MHKDLEFPSEKVNTSMLYLGQGQIEPESYTSNAEEEEAWQAVEKRMNIIGHNGATGAHYGEPMDDNCPAARDGQDSVAVVNKASTGEYEFYPSSNLVDIPNGMHKLYTHPASADEWIKCSDRLPNLGQRVILKSRGVVQNYMPVFDQGGDDRGMGDHFWDFEDINDIDNPLVDFEKDCWMPRPEQLNQELGQ